MDVKTHAGIAADLCGVPVSLAPGRSVVSMATTAAMAADETGLVHGGFVFGMADYAAMLAVNHPNVVLGAAESSFLKPVRVGEVLTAEAALQGESGRKRMVRVSVRREDTEVFTGLFTCFVLDRHILQ